MIDPLRARPLEAVEAILTAHAARFGVARVSEITRLDGIGAPVVAAIRRDPIGESVSVASGRGDTIPAARVAALAEALERYCAEPRGRLAMVTARVGELTGHALPPRALIPAAEVAEDAVLEWCRGETLDGEQLWVPANAVVFPYVPGPGAIALFAGHTHGLAVGATRDEAIVHGLLECIERDAYSRAVALASVGRGDEVPVLAPGCVRAVAGPRIARLERAGLTWLARDVTCDTQVPVVLATVAEGSWSHVGAAAHPDPRAALVRALDEAVQARVVDIQGAREDLAEREPAGPDRWFLNGEGAATVDLPRTTAPGSLDEVLAWLAQRLAAVGVAPIAVDLGLPDVELCVVRAIAPGLETWAYDPSRVGSRARTWLLPR